MKWTRAGRYIATTFRHVIPTVTQEDEGLYTCQADNDLGEEGRAELEVKVLHGPRVSLERRREGEEGETLQVECRAEAKPAPSSYLWTKVGDENFRSEGKYLVLSNLSHADSGEFVCSASNLVTPTHGVPTTRRANSSFTLAVNHKPGPSSVSPGEAVGVEGEEVSLSCESSPPGHPPPQYRWWRTDNPAEQLGSSAKLNLRQLRLGQSGSYSCQAYNSRGRGEAGEGELRVLQPPRVVSHLPHSLTRREGQAGLSLTCQARGKPRPRVQWTFRGEQIGEAEEESSLYTINTTVLSRDTSQPVTVLSSLQFRGKARQDSQEVLPSDAGRYSCIFSNAAGRAETSVELRVEHKPLISALKTDIKVAADIGETAEMKCGVLAYPEPQFSWSRDRSLVGSLGRIMFQSDQKLSDREFQSSFSISSIKENSYGDYMCQASNSLGSSLQTIRLVRKGPPDAPSDLRGSQVGSESIAVSWTEHFHGGLTNITWRLQYRAQGRPRSSLTNVPANGGNLVSGTTIISAQEKLCPVNPCRITGLTQHTTYLLR